MRRQSQFWYLALLKLELGYKAQDKAVKRKGQTASQEGYKRHGVRPQDLVLSRHKHIARVDKTDDPEDSCL